MKLSRVTAKKALLRRQFIVHSSAAKRVKMIIKEIGPPESRTKASFHKGKRGRRST